MPMRSFLSEEPNLAARLKAVECRPILLHISDTGIKRLGTFGDDRDFASAYRFLAK